MLLSLVGCDPYQKVLKSSDLALKLTKAKEYYNKEEYEKSIALFEESLAAIKGTKDFERLYYYYAYAHYGSGDYVMAAYHFKYIAENYPAFENATECEYMSAYCYYLLSPGYNLDQTDTYKAIEAFQLFINNHPSSERVSLANTYMDKLREKLEKKAVESALEYYRIGNYKASVSCFKEVLKEFPDSKQADKLNYYLLKSNYQLAKKSINSKKTERFNLTIDTYLSFIDKFASSKYVPDAQAIYQDAQLQLQKLNKTKQL